MARMLAVFGLLPLQAAILVLGVSSGALSARLKGARVAVPLVISLAYTAVWFFTQNSEKAIEVNPTPWDLTFNTIELLVPFAAPSIGAAIGQWWEKWQDSRAAEIDKEVTEESLLAEKLPEIPAHLRYDLSDLDQG